MDKSHELNSELEGSGVVSEVGVPPYNNLFRNIQILPQPHKKTKVKKANIRKIKKRHSSEDH